MSDMYTDVERSIQQKLLAAMAALGGTQYPIYNNMITKKDFKDAHGAINIMKLSDVPDFANGGGQGAFIRETAIDPDFNISVTPWPDCYDLLYGIEVQADTLAALREMDQLIRNTFPPRGVLYLWDSDNKAFTDQYLDLRYAGYVNRDNPDKEMYWRVTNIRFETFNFNAPSQSTGYIKKVTPLLTIEPSNNS